MKIRAPGKLILSGEHAVVYGHPALAMAVDRYIDFEIKPHALSKVISFDLTDLNYQCDLPFSTLETLRIRVQHRYQLFEKGIIGVRDILATPFELAPFALSLLLQEYQSLLDSIKITIQSAIPMGCGMGSSAALIIGLLFAVAHYFQLNTTPETYYRLALEIENMQHGRSSGLDLQASLQGGCIYRHEGHIYKRDVPFFPMFLVNTGTPDVSTGECVAKVAPFFNSSKMGDEFAAVTHLFDKTLQIGSVVGIKEAIRANHQLLQRIGVVPQKVSQFIHQIETNGGAAKICGAGATQGDQAGMVLVMIEEKSLVENLCMKCGYSVLPIQSVSRGIHVV